MTDQAFEQLLGEIKTIPTCTDLKVFKGQLVAPLDDVLALIEAEIAMLNQLTNPATFIVNLIKIIQATKTKKDDELLKLALQITQLKEALESKASEFQNCVI